MIKKRTRPQQRIREPSPDLSDPASQDAQQQANNEDEAELPYVLGALLCLPFLLFPPNAHPSATVSPNCSSFENFVVRDRE